MKRRAGSRGVTARDRPPNKLRHASHGIQVVTRCLSPPAKPSSYSKIFAAPPDFFNSIFFPRLSSSRGMFRHNVRLSVPNVSALSAPRCLGRLSDKLVGSRVNLVLQNENKFAHVGISMRSVFGIRRFSSLTPKVRRWTSNRSHDRCKRPLASKG